MTPFPEAIAPARRESVLNISHGKGKSLNFMSLMPIPLALLEVVDNMDIAEFIVSPLSDPECIFNAIIRDPYDLSEYFRNVTVNNLTIPMRQKIAHSIGLYEYPFYLFLRVEVH